MGSVVNPIAFRVGHARSWYDAWYVNRLYYPVFLHRMLSLKSLVFFVLYYYIPGHMSRWMFSHVNFYVFNGKIITNVYIYDGTDQDVFKMFARKMKRGFFKQILLKSFWLKKRILDRRFIAKRLVLLLQFINVKYDDFEFDYLERRYKRYKLNKIKFLKKKYGKTWVSKEESEWYIYPFMFFILRRYNQLGLRFLYKFFQRHFTSNKNKHVRRVRLSYIKLFFIFSFIDKVFSMHPAYPKKPFRRANYVRIFKIYYMWFVQRPVLKHVRGLLHCLLSFLQLDGKVNLYILNNPSLSAYFLSRYIMTCLYKDFYYKDVIIPIRKSLDKQLKSKLFVPIKPLAKPLMVRVYNINNDIREKKFKLYGSIIKIYKLHYKIKYNMKFLRRISFKSKYCRVKLINSRLQVLLDNLKLRKIFLSNKKLLRKFKQNKNQISKHIPVDKYLRKVIVKSRSFGVVNRHRVRKRTEVFFNIVKTKNEIFLNNRKNFVLNFKPFLLEFKKYTRVSKFYKRLLNLVKKYCKIRLNRTKKLKIVYNKKFIFLFCIRKLFMYNNKHFIRLFKNLFFLNSNKKSRLKKIELKEFKLKKWIFSLIKFNKLVNCKIKLFRLVFLLSNKRYYLKYVFCFVLNKVMKRKFYNFRRNRNRDLGTLLFFIYFRDNITFNFKSFWGNLKNLKKRIKFINKFKDYKYIKPVKPKVVKSPLIEKLVKRDLLDGGASHLLGYKMRFAGRFTRRQRAANVWFTKGSLSNSAMCANVDYGFFTATLKYSACTVKVWLYKNKKYQTYYYRFV